MRSKLSWSICTAVLTVAVAPATAAAQKGDLSVRAGFEYTSGAYEGPQDVDDRYVPITVLYERERLAVRVTVPYLEVEFTDLTTVDGLPIYTESGLGDVALGLTVFDVFRSADGDLALDLTGKVELPTADEDKGLGTGETDYSLQADFYKYVGNGILAATVGYKIRGEPPGTALDDTWRISFGGLYHFSAAATGGLFVDYRQSSIPGAASIRELIGSLSRRLDDRWRVQGYLIRGLSDTSLDWGAGFSARREF